MVQRTITAVLLAVSCLAWPAGAQDTLHCTTGCAPASASATAFDFSRTIVPVTELKPRGPMLEADFGTGFCIDPNCQFIGTNYHVAVKAPHSRIKGARIVERYLATGPHDEGATLNYLASGGDPLWYNQGRDLAVFELDKPLRQHQGIRFNLDDLRFGQTVDIYVFPKGTINPFRSLQAFNGTFKGVTTTGLLAFDYVPNGGRRIREGASGGIVVDRSTQQIVGILSGFDVRESPVAVAVPVEALAELLNEKLPFLAGLIFPIRAEAPADQPDMYTKYEPPEAAVNLQRRPVEPSAITDLREKAQALAEGMRDFIAVQTFIWGDGNHRPVAADAYEVQVRDGTQRFREYPDGKKWSSNTPWPKADVSATSPGDVWSSLPLFVGTHVGVKIHEADGTEFEGRRVRVFQYVGSDEDNPCIVVDVFNLGLISFEIPHSYTAYGEVWTDESLNFMRMSLHCEKHSRQEWEGVVTFGWFTRQQLEPRLVPVTLVSWSPNRNKGHWCRSQFVDYHEFYARSRILPEATPIDPFINAGKKGGEPPRD